MLQTGLKTRVIRPQAILIEPDEQGESFLPTDNRLFQCGLCGKPNLANARFCGCCGAIFVKIDIPQFPEESAMKKERREYAEPRTTSQSPDRRSAPWADVLKQARYVKMAVAVLLGIILVFANAGFSRKPSPSRAKVVSPDAPVLWPDLQSYLSRQLGISFLEADELAVAALGGLPSPQAAMTCEEAGKFQAFFDSLGGQPMALFADLRADGLLRARHLSTHSKGTEVKGFSDVALDHPLYVSWKNLLDLGIPLGDEENRARPSESASWSDWNQVLGALDDRLHLQGMVKRLTQPEKTGIMTQAEIQKRLVWIKLFFQPGKENPGASAKIRIPANRLDTFGQISALLTQESDLTSTTGAAQ